MHDAEHAQHTTPHTEKQIDLEEFLAAQAHDPGATHPDELEPFTDPLAIDPADAEALEQAGAEALKPRHAAAHDMISHLRRKAARKNSNKEERKAAQAELTELVDGDLAAYAQNCLAGILTGKDLADTEWKRDAYGPAILFGLTNLMHIERNAPAFPAVIAYIANVCISNRTGECPESSKEIGQAIGRSPTAVDGALAYVKKCGLFEHRVGPRGVNVWRLKLMPAMAAVGHQNVTRVRSMLSTKLPAAKVRKTANRKRASSQPSLGTDDQISSQPSLGTDGGQFTAIIGNSNVSVHNPPGELNGDPHIYGSRARLLEPSFKKEPSIEKEPSGAPPPNCGNGPPAIGMVEAADATRPTARPTRNAEANGKAERQDNHHHDKPLNPEPVTPPAEDIVAPGDSGGAPNGPGREVAFFADRRARKGTQISLDLPQIIHGVELPIVISRAVSSGRAVATAITLAQAIGVRIKVGVPATVIEADLRKATAAAEAKAEETGKTLTPSAVLNMAMRYVERSRVEQLPAGAGGNGWRPGAGGIYATDVDGQIVFGPAAKFSPIQKISVTHTQANMVLRDAREYLPETTVADVEEALVEVSDKFSGDTSIKSIVERAVDGLLERHGLSKVVDERVAERFRAYDADEKRKRAHIKAAIAADDRAESGDAAPPAESVPTEQPPVEVGPPPVEPVEPVALVRFERTENGYSWETATGERDELSFGDMEKTMEPIQHPRYVPVGSWVRREHLAATLRAAVEKGVDVHRDLIDVVGFSYRAAISAAMIAEQEVPRSRGRRAGPIAEGERR
jgi:hypothetical protein